MKTEKTVYRLAARPALATALLLLVPLLAMQFTDEVVWTGFDFAVAGALLFGTGFLFELALNRASALAYRAAAGLALASALLLVWLNLAVGIIGSENNPANLLYLGVLAIGAGVARLRPRGTARALFATAIAQLSVPVIALLSGMDRGAIHSDVPGVVGVFILNAIFALLFVASGLLFWRVARANARADSMAAGA